MGFEDVSEGFLLGGEGRRVTCPSVEVASGDRALAQICGSGDWVSSLRGKLSLEGPCSGLIDGPVTEEAGEEVKTRTQWPG